MSPTSLTRETISTSELRVDQGSLEAEIKGGGYAEEVASAPYTPRVHLFTYERR